MKKFIFNILIGFLAGIISGFFGAGGGLILVPYISEYLKEDEKVSRATTILSVFCIVVTSSFFYFSNDLIDWKIGIYCSIGGIIGGLIGSKMLLKSSQNKLKLSFAFFLLYVGIRFCIS